VSLGTPVVTRRAATALIIGGGLATLAALWNPDWAWAPLLWDALVLGACALDYARAPRPERFRVGRTVEPVLSSGAWNVVQLTLEVDPIPRAFGTLRDAVPGGIEVDGNPAPLAIAPDRALPHLSYRIWPHARGDLQLGDAFLRLEGPWRLCARQGRLASRSQVKVYPDLHALTKDALALAQGPEAGAHRLQRRSAEGREFESLRDYQPGDDYRTLDWKATARRAKPMVRVHRPERDQTLLLLLDCGRHMAGMLRGRRKLDLAVDACLRLAKVALDEGDRVGLVAFATQVQAHLPPRKGHDHLRALTAALYRVEASLEESDYGQAVDHALRGHPRRALVALLTDVQDPESAAALVRRTVKLRPRHLPLVISLLDEDVQRVATAMPLGVTAAYERHVAIGLEADYRLTTRRLREAGALALRAPAELLGSAAVSEYFRVKARGLL